MVKRIYDISPPISRETAVYPGDQPFERNISLDFRKGDNLVLSSITTTLHVGAHADAPSHYHPKGVGIDERSLENYLGMAQVVSVRIGKKERIHPEHIKVAIQAKRVLFETGSFPNSNQWREDFNSLSPELVHFLADQGVVLVGIDTPSVDPSDSKRLESHQAIYERDLSILEGVDLTQVPQGLYKLIALPLNMTGADSSPVRAILMSRTMHLSEM